MVENMNNIEKQTNYTSKESLGLLKKRVNQIAIAVSLLLPFSTSAQDTKEKLALADQANEASIKEGTDEMATSLNLQYAQNSQFLRELMQNAKAGKNSMNRNFSVFSDGESDVPVSIKDEPVQVDTNRIYSVDLVKYSEDASSNPNKNGTLLSISYEAIKEDENKKKKESDEKYEVSMNFLDTNGDGKWEKASAEITFYEEGYQIKRSGGRIASDYTKRHELVNTNKLQKSTLDDAEINPRHLMERDELYKVLGTEEAKNILDKLDLEYNKSLKLAQLIFSHNFTQEKASK